MQILFIYLKGCSMESISNPINKKHRWMEECESVFQPPFFVPIAIHR